MQLLVNVGELARILDNDSRMAIPYFFLMITVYAHEQEMRSLSVKEL